MKNFKFIVYAMPAMYYFVLLGLISYTSFKKKYYFQEHMSAKGDNNVHERAVIQSSSLLEKAQL